MKQRIRFWKRMAAGLLTILVASCGFTPANVQCVETETDIAPAAEMVGDAACGQDDLLYNYMLQRSGVTPGMYTSGMRDTVFYSAGISAGARLTGLDAKVYEYLKQEVIKIAAGKRTSTSIEIPLSVIGVSKGPYSAKDLGVNAVVENGKVSEKATQVLYQKVTFDPDKVLAALRNDCPYEMFWKNTKPSYNCRFTSGCTAEYENSEYRLYFKDGPKIDLYVNVDYAVSGQEPSTTIDTNKLAAVQKAIANAQKIVKDNKSKSGKALLEAYRDSICALTSYNHEVSDQKDLKHGNPFQLVYVFDGDSSTNVVCEGYAKAFKYLCDLSADRLPNISCLIVTGQTTEPHMWNIVNMDDNRSYLVDITACDHNDGMPSDWVDTFFLSCPASGSYDTGYEFEYGKGMIMYDPVTGKTSSGSTYKYIYNEETLNCYAVKYLTLSKSAYSEAAASTTTTTTTHNPSTAIMTLPTLKTTTTTTTTTTTRKATTTTTTTRKPTTTTTTTTTRKATTTTTTTTRKPTTTTTTRKPTTTTTTTTTCKPTTTTTTTTTRKPTTTTTTTTTRKPTTTTTTTTTRKATTTTTTTTSAKPVTTTTSETTITTKTLIMPQNEFKLRTDMTYTIPKVADAQIYQTSDPEIAVVSEEGIILALKTGTVLISVEDQNGNGTYLRVEVVDKDAVPYPKGNVNGDIAINAKDAAAVLIAAALNGTNRPNGLTTDQVNAADVDENGVINAKDAATILRYAAAIGTGSKEKIEEFI